MTIEKIFCTANTSGVVFTNQEIWTWGNNENLKQIDVPYGCVNLEFGDSILMLTKSGDVY